MSLQTAISIFALKLLVLLASSAAAQPEKPLCLIAQELLKGECLFACEEAIPAGGSEWMERLQPAPYTLRILNLGGEGEFAVKNQAVINIQPARRLQGTDFVSSRHGMSLTTLVELGKNYDQTFEFVADMSRVPGAKGSVDLIFTHSVPLDTVTHIGPGPTTSGILYLLREGGLWIHNDKTFINRSGKAVPYP